MDIEHNLLFAAFALRGALIDLPALTTACRAWAGRHDTPLADVLVRQGALTPDDRAHLGYLLTRHLDRHHGDSRAGLASLATPELRQALAGTGDVAIAASVAGLPLPPPVAGDELPTSIERMRSPRPEADGAAAEPRYQRLHPHAAGGIGQVWLAYDNAIGREVALKELRPETAQDAGCRQRFLDEARVTGQLEHPGIVPVHELVKPADGTQPYYVMRFVKGRTLRAAVEEYHAKAREGRASRVELLGLLNAFVAVCNAVAFAHAQGVLHRDLKGQNVILGDFGEVIVLDWGLARRVKGGAEARDQSTAITAAPQATLPGQVMGTPGYMAPEQAAGQIDLIDARTDVYGLGAILYEILTARPPFTTGMALGSGTGTALDLPALLQRIQTEAPTPPRRVNRRVPAPLQAICLTALARDREDRYGSAAELAREVQRWLADEPVDVYPEPLHLRLARWGRRHKLAVTGLAVLLVCAVVGLAVNTLLVNQERERTERARARAEKNYTLARDAVKKFYVQVSEEELLNEPGLQPIRLKLLETASAFYANLAATEDDPELRAEHGRTLLALAEVLKQMSQTDEALKRVAEAEKIFTDLQAHHPRNAEYRHGVGSCHLKRGAVLYHAKSRELAAQEWEHARAVLLTAGTAAGVRRDLSHCANNLGTYYNLKATRLKDPEERQQWFDWAAGELAASERGWQGLIKDYPQDTKYPSFLGTLYQNQTKLYKDQGKNQEALEAVGKSLKLYAGLAQRDRKNLENRGYLGAAHGQSALCLELLERPDAAEQEYQTAVTILEPLAEENRAVTFYQTELANVYFHQGLFWHNRLAKLAGADAAALHGRIMSNYRKTQAIYEALHLKYPREVLYLHKFASMYVHLGNVIYPNWNQALPLYDRGIATLTPLADHPEFGAEARRLLSDAFWARAEWLDATKKFDESLTAWDRAAQLRNPPSIDLYSSRAHTRLQLAEQLLKANNLAGAAALAEEVAREPKLTGQVWVEAGNLFGRCGLIAWEAGQSAQAEHYANRALALLRRAHDAGALRTPHVREKLQRDLRRFELLRRNADFQRLLRG